ncbi:MAG TPA: c-type cytochrome biogenesis protein CcmI [Paenirhodobacter sp.]
MLFWIPATALVGVLILVFGLALRRGLAQAGGNGHDLRVYRAQLAEIDRDLARGVLPEDEAARTRIDIARRMLDADRSAPPDETRTPQEATLAALAVIVLALLAAVIGYAQIGAPGYADQPLRIRLAAAEALYHSRPTQEAAEARAEAMRAPAPAADPDFLALMARLRATMADRPDDETGLALLARNEMRLGNFHAGWQAQQRLIALKGAGAEADDHARLGEDMTIAAGGLVTPEAEAAFVAALDSAPDNGRARYYLGLMMAQNGRGDRAFAMWQALLRTSPPNAPWRAPIRQNIRALAWLAGQEDDLPPDSATETPTENLAAGREMVARLNDRLARDGGIAADWARLISALRVLGETARATRIATEARDKFAADPAALDLIDTALAAPAGAALSQEPLP